MRFNKKGYNKKQLLELYKQILYPRMIEEKMLVLLRQGRISKWFSGIGQEAIAIGVAAALEKDDYILPMHRNLGVFTSREIPLERLFAQFQGKEAGFTTGRDRSFHFGTNEHRIVGMISHLGPQLAVGSGISLANSLADEALITVAFTGDGGTSEGDFHEAMNVAAVWNIPIIFVIENNGYGLSTPVSEQYKCEHLSDRGIGYGMEAHRIDGNNVLEVHRLIKKLRKSILKDPRPVMVECETFRMRGHEEASGTKYVPKELMEYWAKKDPVQNFEDYLKKEKVLTEKQIAALRAEIKSGIEESLQTAYDFDEITEANTDQELSSLYCQDEVAILEPDFEHQSERRFVDAISDGLKQSMQRHDKLLIMGQDVADYGGVFKITDGFMDEFGRERVRNTPLCESAILGIGLGLSIKGYKSVVEMQFADFVTCGFNQIINNLSKSHYRWGQNADVVVRMPTGGGVAAGPFHSQSNEAWFFHSPGLKIVYPSNPFDAKGLLMAAIEDPNPVMYFEHKALYRSISSEIPDDPYMVEIGKASLCREGTDLSIITYGMGVHWAIEVLDKHKDISADVLDLRTLVPMDTDAVLQSVKKTGKALVLHEDSFRGGIGGEIASMIAQQCFEFLDGPVMRVGSLDTPVPFNAVLEQNYLPKQRLEEALLGLYNY